MNRLEPGKIYEAKKWFVSGHNGDFSVHDEFVGMLIEHHNGPWCKFLVGDEIREICISKATKYADGWQVYDFEEKDSGV